MSVIRARRLQQSGYGLIVVAALFTAFAVVAAATIERNNATADMTMQANAKAQLQKLNIALIKYARYNNSRFPCPASERVLPSNVNFGNPATAACYTGQTVSADTPFLTGTTTSNVLIRGMVPVRALIPYGVSLNDAFDPWGNRILYVVHRDLTTSSPATTIGNGDKPFITEYNTGETYMPRPDVVLVSLGKDRLDARTRSQTNLTAPGTACSAATATDRRAENCDNDVNFLAGPALVAANAAPSVYFDDTISALSGTSTAAPPPSPPGPLCWDRDSTECDAYAGPGCSNGRWCGLYHYTDGSTEYDAFPCDATSGSPPPGWSDCP